MASSSPAESPSSVAPSTSIVSAGGSGSLIGRYLNRISRTVQDRLPSLDSPLLAVISDFYQRLLPTRRQRRRRPSLPLPLHFYAAQPSPTTIRVVEDVMECTLCYLHGVQKSLHFWQTRAEGTNARKIYFMIFERGPLAFIDGTYGMLSRLHTGGSPIQHLSHVASSTISHRIAILSSLSHCLANFLAQVYLEVNKYEGILLEDVDKSLPLLLLTINNLFLKLEVSITQIHEICKGERLSSVDENSSFALQFEKIPYTEEQKIQWTNTEIRDATEVIHKNLQRFELYLVGILSTCEKPNKLSIYWLHYTCGAIGLSLCSMWLLRHSSLMGSSDIENWINEAKESAAGFLKDHVEQPLISIRDELFETFRRRHKGVMEAEEVQLTAESLHRMLLAFCEQTKTKGQKMPDDIPDQQLLEMVMARYEKEVMHPLQNLLSGELAGAMLIQIQKLKLDLEIAMLELDQILKANEINFAVLAALPAFVLSLLLLMLVRAWIMQDKGAEGRGRVARRQRRLLLVEVEERLVEFQTCMDQGKAEDAQSMYGLMLYTLDLLYKAVEKHAKETGEWIKLRKNIMDLAKPDLSTERKFAIILRMGRMYESLLPSSRRV
ncbi:protein DGS1, mitochondrial-like [Curcuma longa]|uniref:protein DGS1, mitochondrial-like n=1 Tax=Curcuma longa TaxID=136217 RepID=UPI003D9F1767